MSSLYCTQIAHHRYTPLMKVHNEGARRLTVPIHKYQFHYEPQAAINEKEIREL